MAGGIPAQDLHFATFQPSFLYELIWDLALAAFLVWLGHHARMRPWTLFALYVAGYSAYRIFEETIRIDSSEYFLGLRLNMFVAIALTVVGLVWFALAQRRPERPFSVLPASAAGSVDDVKPDEAAAVTADPEDAADDPGRRRRRREMAIRRRPPIRLPRSRPGRTMPQSRRSVLTNDFLKPPRCRRPSPPSP